MHQYLKAAIAAVLEQNEALARWSLPCIVANKKQTDSLGLLLFLVASHFLMRQLY